MAFHISTSQNINLPNESKTKEFFTNDTMNFYKPIDSFIKISKYKNNVIIFKLSRHHNMHAN